MIKTTGIATKKEHCNTTWEAMSLTKYRDIHGTGQKRIPKIFTPNICKQQ